MNKLKISKILGVGLALVMVFSLMLGFMPAQKAQAVEGNMQWLAQTLPSNTSQVLVRGTDVTDIAVGPDGTTIYAISNVASANTTAALYKSTNAGQSFTAIDLSTVVSGTTTLTGNLSCVAVAPDNPNAVAFAVRYVGAPDLDTVYISTTGGISWAALPAFAAPAAAATSIVTDLAVGPARSGTIFGREYMAALADLTVNVQTAADVQIIGGGAAWASVGAAGAVCAGLFDYMACQFSPSYVGDRTVALVGAHQTTGVQLQLVDARTGQNIRTVILDANVDDYRTTAAGNTIMAADIALPIDWDPSTAGGQRTYVCTASFAAANDSVYRVDAATTWDLGVGVTNIQWNSVAYSGTIAAGKLFAGAYAPTGINTNVSYAADPQLLQPLWRGATTAPTGDNGLAVVRVAPDFGTTNRVFVGTTGTLGAGGGDQSAFSVSYNGGVSYQQESLIDADTAANTVVAIDDIALTPDASTIFMATRNTGNAQISLWKSAAATVGSTSWSRIFCVAPAVAGPAMLAVNPGYATTPALIFADTSVGGRMRVSKDGGDTYAARWAPSPAVALRAMAMESADVVYSAQGANVFKSTNACWIWGAPYAIGLGNITVGVGLDASAAGLVLVGATNGVAYSTDGGATYAPIFAGLPAGAYIAAPDSGYATNKLIYATNSAPSGLVYRYDLGTGVGWTDLGRPLGLVTFETPVGIASNNGLLYAMTDCAGTVAGAAVTADCPRINCPFIEPGLTAISWDDMNVWAAAPLAAIASFTAQNNDLFCATAATNMWAYKDYLATAKPTLTSPAAGATIGIDPVSGRANDVTLSWKMDNALNTGTGMAFAYQVEIAEAGTGFAAPRNTWISPTGAVIAGTTPLAGLDPTNPKITIGAAAGQWGINLIGGTAYEWHVRVRSQTSADIVRSGWSAAGSFTVEASSGVISPEYSGPILQAPTPGAIGASLTPGFAWAPISGAVKYEFELSKSAATTARGYFVDALVGLTGTNALVTPGWQCDTTLDYGTSYFWHVKGITAAGTETIWGTAQFTTITAGVFTCPICGLTFATQAELEAHNAAAHAPVIPQTPAYIWAVVIIGAILVIVVIALIFTTRRVS